MKSQVAVDDARKLLKVHGATKIENILDDIANFFLIKIEHPDQDAYRDGPHKLAVTALGKHISKGISISELFKRLLAEHQDSFKITNKVYRVDVKDEKSDYPKKVSCLEIQFELSSDSSDNKALASAL